MKKLYLFLSLFAVLCVAMPFTAFASSPLGTYTYNSSQTPNLNSNCASPTDYYTIYDLTPGSTPTVGANICSSWQNTPFSSYPLASPYSYDVLENTDTACQTNNDTEPACEAEPSFVGMGHLFIVSGTLSSTTDAQAIIGMTIGDISTTLGEDVLLVLMIGTALLGVYFIWRFMKNLLK